MVSLPDYRTARPSRLASYAPPAATVDSVDRRIVAQRIVAYRRRARSPDRDQSSSAAATHAPGREGRGARALHAAIRPAQAPKRRAPTQAYKAVSTTQPSSQTWLRRSSARSIRALYIAPTRGALAAPHGTLRRPRRSERPRERVLRCRGHHWPRGIRSLLRRCPRAPCAAKGRAPRPPANPHRHAHVHAHAGRCIYYIYCA